MIKTLAIRESVASLWAMIGNANTFVKSQNHPGSVSNEKYTLNYQNVIDMLEILDCELNLYTFNVDDEVASINSFKMGSAAALEGILPSRSSIKSCANTTEPMPH